jgi:hypothetical protein
MNPKNPRTITWQGRTQTIGQWAKELGLSRLSLTHRINRGWELELAMTRPLKSEGTWMKKGFIDMTGQRIGRLLITGYGGFYCWRGKQQAPLFQWVCDCGSKGSSTRHALMHYQKSCGCFMEEWRRRPGPRPVTKHRSRLPMAEAGRNIMFYRYKSSAGKDGKSWNLSKELFSQIVIQNCHYCGASPSGTLKLGKFTGVYLYNGIDRVVNSIGYEPHNVVACCKTCNRAKFQMSPDEFVDWALRVINHTQPHIVKAA